MVANISTTMRNAAWESWRLTEYFQDYYSRQIEPDEQAAIRFQVEFLRRAGRTFPRALESGILLASGQNQSR